MGYDIYGAKGGSYRINGGGWRDLIKLALLFGWEGEGTTLDYDPYDESIPVLDWDGDYFSCDGQFVSENDALNLARSLEAGLDDIPDFSETNAPSDIPDIIIANVRRVAPKLKFYNSGNILEIWSGEDKLYLIEFIEFCKASGGFYIN